RSDEPSQSLERVRSRWEVDLSEDKRIDADQPTLDCIPGETDPFGDAIKSPWLETAVVVDGGVRMVLGDPQHCPKDVSFFFKRIGPQRMDFHSPFGADKQADEVVRALIGNSFHVEENLGWMFGNRRRLVEVDFA